MGELRSLQRILQAAQVAVFSLFSIHTRTTLGTC